MITWIKMVNLHHYHNHYPGSKCRQAHSRYAFLLLVSLCMILGACKSVQPTSPIARDFSIVDMLIGLPEMPKGWLLNEQPQRFQETGAIDAVGIAFTSGGGEPRNRASIGIYNYATTEESTTVFNKIYEPRVHGDFPLNWSNPQLSASQYTLGCYNWEGREPYACTWIAQYQEFIVQFDTWIINGYMSFEDFEKVVTAIDNKMTLYLESPP